MIRLDRSRLLGLRLLGADTAVLDMKEGKPTIATMEGKPGGAALETKESGGKPPSPALGTKESLGKI